MRKNLPLGFCVYLAVVSPGVTQAEESNWYGGVNYLFLNIKDKSGTIDRTHNGALALSLGYRGTNNLALEGWLGTGVRSGSFDYLGREITLETKDFYAVVLRPYIRLRDDVELYGRVGYFSGRLSASNGGLSLTERDSDLAYGLGVAFYNSKRNSFSIDYTQFYDKENTQIRGFGIGASVRF